MIKQFVNEINPSFNKWDELDWILMAFKTWEPDPAEPPSSGAFLCASKSNDLAAGATAFFACAGEKHLPFEKVIRYVKSGNFKFGQWYGFGHPVYAQDPRVVEFYKKFKTKGLLEHGRQYVKDGKHPCLNFAGLFGIWCVANGFDERAAILPLMSRLLGLCELYEYNKSLPSSNECINNPRISSRSES